jgi:hypothetical protein
MTAPTRQCPRCRSSGSIAVAHSPVPNRRTMHACRDCWDALRSTEPPTAADTYPEEFRLPHEDIVNAPLWSDSGSPRPQSVIAIWWIMSSCLNEQSSADPRAQSRQKPARRGISRKQPELKLAHQGATVSAGCARHP